MAGNTPELTVRRHERLECEIAGRLRVASQSADAFRLSRSSGQEWFGATVVDVSDGGVGLRTATFVPKACWMEVALDGDSEARPVLVRVQRVTMLDRTPLYYLGTSFSREEAEMASARSLIERVRECSDGGTRA